MMPRRGGRGSTVAAFVAMVTAGAIVVLSMGSDPRPSAAGRRASTSWRWAGWRRRCGVGALRRCCDGSCSGCGVGVAGAWLALLALDAAARPPWPLERTPSSTSSQAGTAACPCGRAGARGLGLGSVVRAVRARRLHRRLGLLDLSSGDRRDRPQRRPGEVRVDQFACGVVEGGRGAAVRAGSEPEVGDVVRSPAFQDTCTVQRPSSLRHASQLVDVRVQGRARSARR